MRKKIGAFILSCVIVFSVMTPALLHAQTKLIPCDGEDCNFQQLMVLFNNVVTFILFTLATPFAAIVFAYAGWLYMREGDTPGNKKQTKERFVQRYVGYVVALGAYLIVKVIMQGLGFDATNFDAFY